MASQFGQDAFVLDLLGGKRGGYFVDSGASDGVQGSNTELLERSFGWKGICVEHNDEFFAALVRNRRCCCINCCLYNREGRVAFIEADVLGGILSELPPAQLLKLRTLSNTAEGVQTVPKTVHKKARTIRSVLVECSAPPVIDYWSLDTEGSEFAILQSFPFDEYRLRVLTVEHNRYPVRKTIYAFLKDRGYLLAKTFEIDDCYVKEENEAFPAWRSASWAHPRSADRY
jgi:hypothetical protein